MKSTSHLSTVFCEIRGSNYRRAAWSSFVSLWISAIPGLISCGETSGPGSSTGKAAVIAAATPTSINSTVGASVLEPPAVLVQDSKGNPVGGVVVTFSIAKGGGTATGTVATSNAAGVARIGSWTLGRAPGLNVLAAASPSLAAVEFSATTVAGPPTRITKVAGDNQEAVLGASAAIPPQVFVSDAFGNGIAGVQVSFSIASGGGSLSNPVVTTNAAGVAAVGGWKFGTEAEQSVVARAGEMTPQIFRAILPFVYAECGTPEQIIAGVTLQSQFTATSCKGYNGSYYKVMSVTLTNQANLFSLTSSDFDTYLFLYSGEIATNLIGSNDNASPITTNSEIKAILPPGTYRLVATSLLPSTGGSFSINIVPASEIVRGCEKVFVSRGVSTYQVTQSNDCLISTFGNADRFQIFLQQGSPVTVSVNDQTYSNHPLSLLDASGEIVMKGYYAGNYLDALQFTASSNGFYTIEVSNAGEDGAAYILSVK